MGVQHLLSTNPNTGEPLGATPITTPREVRQAVRRAREAQSAWGAAALRERLRVLRRVQKALVEQCDEVASRVSQETGKSLTESLVGDVLLVLTSLNGYLKLAPRVLRKRRIGQGWLHFNKRLYVVPEPVGVVGVISPYNFPVLLSMQSAFAALIAGNAVVHKPSERTPLTALLIEQILRGSGLEPDLFQAIPGDGRTGAALVEAGVDHLAFVGSSQTGRKIASQAGGQLLPVTLELGGNNAMIVLADAPLERAVDAALTYAFAANGQMCGAVSRIYVDQSVAGDFLERLTNRARDWRVSTDTAPGASEVTALVDESALQCLEEQYDQALDAGAIPLCGGSRLAGSTAPVFEPAILTGVSPHMRVCQEEAFGPLVSVMPVESVQEAIQRANGTPYGLTASVWSRNTQHAWQVAGQLQVGTVAINDHLWPFLAPEVPWGGVKASGLGRVGGEWGLRSMTTPKVISQDVFSLKREFYWHPVTYRQHLIMRQLVPLLYHPHWKTKWRALVQLLLSLLPQRKTGRQSISQKNPRSPDLDSAP